MSAEVASTQRAAVCLTLHGEVQGHGARPAIARHAAENGVAGTVRNTRGGLEVFAEGDADSLGRFCRSISAVLPEECRLDSIDEQPAEITGAPTFEIVRDEDEGALATPVPRDLGVCPQCLSEVADTANRRYRYPLTSCAACGPRYTILRGMPYERSETAMERFPFCTSCEREYRDSCDRRFHAQTTCCADCGPRIWGIDRDGGAVGQDEQAIDAVVAALREGKIVALRGIGGYQLLCDATSDEAVRKLRTRKHRPGKPLAILVHSLAAAQKWAHLSTKEQEVLCAASNPIVLLRARPGTTLSREIHPGLDNVGVMLPTTPLHEQIAREFDAPLVCTSANREGEPLEYDAAAAQRHLAGIVDLWLHHDRPIERPIDDSVVRVIANRPTTLRLARGLAPLPLQLDCCNPIMALGGHQKVAAAWSNGAQSVLGPHIGDLETVATRERFDAQRADWERLYGFVPSRIVHDLHPDYFTTRLATGSQSSAVAVQHHFAHVAAGMLEHALLDRTVLGVAWDGTGYGTDGAIWGGEFLVVDGAERFERVASLRPFALAGGEAAIREPGRITLALLQEAIGAEELSRASLPSIEPSRMPHILAMLKNPRLSVSTTSAGRLFDAVAALVLPVKTIQYDGEPAMVLESVADYSEPGAYRLPLVPGEPIQLDWRLLIADIWQDFRRGVSPGIISMRFHRTLAEGIAAVALRFSDLPIVLTGGVFQNRLLTELVVERLNDIARLKLPGVIPANDGGLAAGQLTVAACQLGIGC